MLFIGWRLVVFVVRCSLIVVCCLFWGLVVCYVLLDLWSSVCVVCSLLYVVCCLLCIVCCLSFVVYFALLVV